MESELKHLLEQKDLLDAMKKSVHETEKKLNTELEDFLEKHLGVQKGATTSILDLIKRAAKLG